MKFRENKQKFRGVNLLEYFPYCLWTACIKISRRLWRESVNESGDFLGPGAEALSQEILRWHAGND